jgi:hypothetical protein
MSAGRRGFNRALTNDYRLAQHNVRVFGEGFGEPFLTQKRVPRKLFKTELAGAGGFEPPNADSKDPCLAT